MMHLTSTLWGKKFSLFHTDKCLSLREAQLMTRALATLGYSLGPGYKTL